MAASSLSFWPGGSRTDTRIAVAVTPVAVAPPLSAPLGHARTHGGANGDGNLMRLRSASQFGLANASAVPVPGNEAVAAPAAALDDAASAAVVAVRWAAPADGT